MINISHFVASLVQLVEVRGQVTLWQWRWKMLALLLMKVAHPGCTGCWSPMRDIHCASPTADLSKTYLAITLCIIKMGADSLAVFPTLRCSILSSILYWTHCDVQYRVFTHDADVLCLLWTSNSLTVLLWCIHPWLCCPASHPQFVWAWDLSLHASAYVLVHVSSSKFM